MEWGFEAGIVAEGSSLREEIALRVGPGGRPGEHEPHVSEALLRLLTAHYLMWYCMYVCM